MSTQSWEIFALATTVLMLSTSTIAGDASLHAKQVSDQGLYHEDNMGLSSVNWVDFKGNPFNDGSVKRQRGLVFWC